MKNYQQFSEIHGRWFPLLLATILGGERWYVNSVHPFVGGFKAERLSSKIAGGRVRLLQR